MAAREALLPKVAPREGLEARRLCPSPLKDFTPRKKCAPTESDEDSDQARLFGSGGEVPGKAEALEGEGLSSGAVVPSASFCGGKSFPSASVSMCSASDGVVQRVGALEGEVEMVVGVVVGVRCPCPLPPEVATEVVLLSFLSMPPLEKENLDRRKTVPPFPMAGEACRGVPRESPLRVSNRDHSNSPSRGTGRAPAPSAGDGGGGVGWVACNTCEPNMSEAECRIDPANPPPPPSMGGAR